MTIPEQQVRFTYAGPIAEGDEIPVPFNYMDEEDTFALVDGDTRLIYGVDYSVTGQKLTLLTPIPEGKVLTVLRSTPLNNDAEFPQEADFDSEKINDAIDKLTMQNQEQEEKLNRCLMFSSDAGEALVGIRFPVPEAKKFIRWNNEGTALINSKYELDDLYDVIIKGIDRIQEYVEQANQVLEEVKDIQRDIKETLDGSYVSKEYLETRLNNLSIKGLTKEEYEELPVKEENMVYHIKETEVTE